MELVSMRLTGPAFFGNHHQFKNWEGFFQTQLPRLTGRFLKRWKSHQYHDVSIDSYATILSQKKTKKI